MSGDMIIFDNSSAKAEMAKIEEQYGSPKKINTTDVGRVKKYINPSQDIAAPWTTKEKEFQKYVQEKSYKGYRTVSHHRAEGDIDESVFSMDNLGDPTYMYWPYIPDASFELMTEDINQKIGRDKKKFLNEHSSEIREQKRSAFDTWLNNGF